MLSLNLTLHYLTHLKLDFERARRVEDVVGVLDELDEGGGGREGVRLALQQ